MSVRLFVSSLLSRERIAGGALVLAALQLLASVVGFFRDQAFSIMFPLHEDPIGVASVYIAAFRPSDLLFQITVMSCLSVILVPFLSSHLAHKRDDEVSTLLTSTMMVFGILFGVGALVLAVIFEQVAPFFVKFEGESLRLYVQYGRIALLTNFLFVFGNALGQYLIAEQRYWIYGLTPIIWGMSTVAGTYLLTPLIGPLGPIIGTLIGTTLYLIIRFASALDLGYRLRLPRGFFHADLLHMGWLIIPRMCALGALQLQLLLLDRLASGLGTDAVAINQFARNFESLIPGIVGISLAQAAFSPLSQSAALGEFRKFIGQLKRGVLYNTALSIPGAIALALLAGVGAWLIRLGPETVPFFVTALGIYAIAVPFECVNHMMLRSFYAMKNTTLPAVSSVLSLLVAVPVASYFIDSLGVYSLAIAFVGSQIVQTAFLGIALPRAVRTMSHSS